MGGGPQLADSCFWGCAHDTVWQGKRRASLKVCTSLEWFYGCGWSCYMETCRERLIFKPLAFITWIQPPSIGLGVHISGDPVIKTVKATSSLSFAPTVKFVSHFKRPFIAPQVLHLLIVFFWLADKLITKLHCWYRRRRDWDSPTMHSCLVWNFLYNLCCFWSMAILSSHHLDVLGLWAWVYS